MLTVLQRRLEAILPVDTLALKHRDILEATLSHLLKLGVDVREKFVLFILGECASGLAMCLWDGIHRTLHALDLERAGNISIKLWLPHFAKEEKVCSELLLMRIDPEEG